MEQYDHEKIEKKWQDRWEKKKAFAADDRGAKHAYILDMFPYPSAEGLHVGHPEGYTASDIFSRYLRMKGFNVLHPMGFDAFGLPAENYALKTGTHPTITTKKNIEHMREQIKSLGFSYDWDREVITSDPKYYKWTQWIFVQLFKHGLAYEAEAPINWCPSCKTGLANEEVVAGKCERCGTEVTKKHIKQWLVKITDERYIERLLHDLDDLDWPENIKDMQRNWIGKSEGAEITFRVIANPHTVSSRAKSRDLGFEEDSGTLRSAQGGLHGDTLKVFTTRPDTIFGATYMIVAPEHPMIKKNLKLLENAQEVQKYIDAAARKSDLERTDLAKEKTGIELKGIIAINPASGKEIPVWVAGYVLASYGTGAIMAVPAHDQRDFEFAKKYGLEIRQVIAQFISPTNEMDLPKKDKKTVRREVVYIILKHWKDNSFFCLNWEKYGWKSFIIGGVDKNETAKAAAYREVQEETGYQNVRIVKEVGWMVHQEFFAAHKDENRYSMGRCYYAELKDGDFKKPDDNEVMHHQGMWVPKEQIPSFINLSNHHWYWDQLSSGQKAFNGEGKIINSGKYDGMDSVEFRKKIVKDLSSKTKKNTCVVVHGISGHKKENWFPWIKQETAKLGWETTVPSLPGAGHPTLKSWNGCLHGYNDQVNEQSILVGHSLGCSSILYYLQTSGKKVDTVILVAPTNPDQHWPELEKKYPDNDWKAVKEISEDKNFDWKKIRTLARRFVILHSDNDHYIPPESMDYFRKKLPEAEIHLVPGKHHFSESHDIKSLPEILPFFPEPSVGAQATVNYKLRDWVFSRQRYWGEPIPIVHCEKCGYVPVPEKDLPVELPKVEKYQPTGTGESPLAVITEWVNTKCPECGGKAKRETNTMPQWAGSNWYFLRYCDPKNDKKLADPKKLEKWLPVDLYIGGAEHAVLHLLYARFIYKFLYDIKAVPKKVGDEPFKKLKNQGLILGEDGVKMSKSRGNVINPDDIIHEYGADAMRMYEMFMGPLDDPKPWSTRGIVGVTRFIEKIWKIGNSIGKAATQSDPSALQKTHQLIKKISSDIESFKFNTAISTFMEYINYLSSRGDIKKVEFDIFLILLSPFAPHLTEELWKKLGNKKFIISESWPTYRQELDVENEINIVIQINGKVRDQILMPLGTGEEEIKRVVLNREKVQKWLDGKTPKKVVYVKGKILSIVV